MPVCCALGCKALELTSANFEERDGLTPCLIHACDSGGHCIVYEFFAYEVFCYHVNNY